MDFEVIFVFFALSLLSFFNCRNSTKGMIVRLGINMRFYPKHYKVLHRKLKRFFRIKNTTIPQFLFYELFVSILFAILGPINTIIYLCYNNKELVGHLIMLHIILIIINFIYFAINSTVFYYCQEKRNQ